MVKSLVRRILDPGQTGLVTLVCKETIMLAHTRAHVQAFFTEDVVCTICAITMRYIYSSY